MLTFAELRNILHKVQLLGSHLRNLELLREKSDLSIICVCVCMCVCIYVCVCVWRI